MAFFNYAAPGIYQTRFVQVCVSWEPRTFSQGTTEVEEAQPKNGLQNGSEPWISSAGLGYRVFSRSKSPIFQTQSYEIGSSSGSSSKRITQCRYELPINTNNSNARCSKRGYSSSINLINPRTAVLSLVWLALIRRPLADLATPIHPARGAHPKWWLR